MALHIDRVDAELELLRAPRGEPEREPARGERADLGSRERLRALVLEVVQEHLRDLQRRGSL